MCFCMSSFGKSYEMLWYYKVDVSMQGLSLAKFYDSWSKGIKKAYIDWFVFSFMWGYNGWCAAGGSWLSGFLQTETRAY